MNARPVLFFGLLACTRPWAPLLVQAGYSGRKSGSLLEDKYRLIVDQGCELRPALSLPVLDQTACKCILPPSLP